MKVLFRTDVLRVIAVLLAIAIQHGDVCAQEATSGDSPAAEAASPGVLVLQDGGVLEGTIKRVGDRYTVTRAGSEVQIAAARVMLVAGSLEEAYAARRRQFKSPTAENHLDLADWCLRCNLLELTAAEINDARKLDPGDPRLPSLERRLAMAKVRPPQPAPAERPAPAETAIVAPHAPAQIDDLPPGAVELFTRRVQPVLVNNCTAGGCHQVGGQQQFQLDRSLLHGLANRRATMQNLSATLMLIDREQPHLSTLLTLPRRTHGGMEEPVFGPKDDAAFRHLVGWVALVTRASKEEKSAPVAEEQETAEPEGMGDVASNVQDSEAAATPDDAATFPLPSMNRLQIGARATKWQPRDAFDPEIFNRETAARRTSIAPARQDAEADVR